MLWFPLAKVSIRKIPNRNFYDIVIAGCGVSGAFCASRLNKYYPDLRILIVEKNSQPGGKLISEDIGSDIAIEYGGMRYFPKVHHYVHKLVQLLRLETVEKPFIVPNNLAYLRGKHYRIGSLSEQDSYRLSPREEGHSPSEYVVNVIKKQLAAMNVSLDTILENSYLSSINFWQFLKMNMSNEMFNFYRDVSGYNKLIDNFHSGLVIYNTILLSQPDSPQLLITTGYQSLVFSLLNQLSNNVILMTNTQLTKFQHSGNTITCILKGPNYNHIVQTNKLILAIPRYEVVKLYHWSHNILDLFDLLSPAISLKIFIRFREKWWHRLGLFSGRSVTDLPLRQVWYYTDNIIMIYCDAINVHFWINLLKVKGSHHLIHRQSWIDINMVDSLLVYHIMSQLSEMHNYPVETYMASSISWNLSLHDSYTWKPCDVISVKKKLENPLPNIYLINSCWSLIQGWVDGSIRNADDLLAQYFGIPSVLND